MESDPKSQLQDWKKIMGPENRLSSIRWLSGGSIENESMVVRHLKHMEGALLERRPNLESIIYTNCVDIEGWSNSYVTEKLPIKAGHVWKRGTEAAIAMWLEEGLTADAYVCNGCSAAFALYGLGLNWYNRPMPPVVTVFAYIPRPDDYWGYTMEAHTLEFFRYAGAIDSFWIVVLDRMNEEIEAKKIMAKAGYPYFNRIRRATTWIWEEKEFAVPRRDVVIWSGRRNTAKNPYLAADVFAQMPESVRKEVYCPRESSGGGTANQSKKRFEKVSNLEMIEGLPPEQYRERAGSAKALLITSQGESYPVGYFELMGLGVLPVIHREPWIENDLLPDDWPYIFDTHGEAVEMILDAIERYDEMASRLYSWMKERYTRNMSFADIMDEVWEEYTVELGTRIRLISQSRGDWKGL